MVSITMSLVITHVRNRQKVKRFLDFVLYYDDDYVLMFMFYNNYHIPSVQQPVFLNTPISKRES